MVPTMPRTCQKLLVLWMGGWLEKMKIMQTQLQLKLKLKLKLSLAIEKQTGAELCQAQNY